MFFRPWASSGLGGPICMVLFVDKSLHLLTTIHVALIYVPLNRRVKYRI